MKSIMINKIRDEFEIRSIGRKKLELYKFYTLCGFYKKLKAGEQVK